MRHCLYQRNRPALFTCKMSHDALKSHTAASSAVAAPADDIKLLKRYYNRFDMTSSNSTSCNTRIFCPRPSFFWIYAT